MSKERSGRTHLLLAAGIVLAASCTGLAVLLWFLPEAGSGQGGPGVPPAPTPLENRPKVVSDIREKPVPPPPESPRPKARKGEKKKEPVKARRRTVDFRQVYENFRLPLDGSLPRPDVEGFLQYVYDTLSGMTGNPMARVLLGEGEEVEEYVRNIQAVNAELEKQGRPPFIEDLAEINTVEYVTGKGWGAWITHSKPEGKPDEEEYYIQLLLGEYRCVLVVTPPLDHFEVRGCLRPSRKSDAGRHIIPPGTKEYDFMHTLYPVENLGFSSFELFRNANDQGKPYVKWRRIIYLLENDHERLEFSPSVHVTPDNFKLDDRLKSKSEGSAPLEHPSRVLELLKRITEEVDYRISLVKQEIERVVEEEG